MTARENLATTGRFILGLVACLLLTSIGGAGIAASPLTVPLLGWAARTSGSRAARITLTAIGVLTIVEAAWLPGYWLSGGGRVYPGDPSPSAVATIALWLPLAAVASFVFVRLTLHSSR